MMSSLTYVGGEATRYARLHLRNGATQWLEIVYNAARQSKQASRQLIAIAEFWRQPVNDDAGNPDSERRRSTFSPDPQAITKNRHGRHEMILAAK